MNIDAKPIAPSHSTLHTPSVPPCVRLAFHRAMNESYTGCARQLSCVTILSKPPRKQSESSLESSAHSVRKSNNCNLLLLSPSWFALPLTQILWLGVIEDRVL